MVRRSLALLLAVLLLALVSGPARAIDLREEIARLIETGSQNTIKARTEAQDQYEQLKKAAPAEIRVDYAFALVQIKQRDYPKAAKLLDEIVAAAKTDPHAFKAKSWVSVITKNYPAALLELDRLSQLLPADAAADEAEEQNLEFARYLGRVYGFLDGPAADAVGEASREAAKKKVLGRLSESRQAAFEEARSRVLAAFNGLGVEKEESEEKAKVAAEEEREKLLADLETRKDQLAVRRSEFGPRRDKLRSELQAVRDQLAKEERPLVADLNAINAQGAGLRRELDLFASDILRLQAQFDKEKDPVLRDRLRREIERLNFVANRIEGNLVTLQRQAVGVNNQLAEVQRRHGQSVARISGELNRVEAEAAALDKQEKRNDQDLAKAKKPAVGDVRRSRSLSAQAAAFTTYEEFPLEAEKQRLLDSIR